MSDQAHRGARAPGPLTQTADRRVGELDEALRVTEVISGAVPLFGFMRDMLRVSQGHNQQPHAQGRFGRGTIIHALPHLNWYKVQCGPQQGWVAACKLDQCGLVPLGPRETGVLPPNTQVLLHFPAGLGHAHIMGVIPPALENGSISVPDWIVQGGGSGLKREPAHKFPLTSLYRQGGVIDWSANRPVDETAFMKGWISATGLALTIDDALLQVRVNEMCGLFLTLYDSWCRLAGVQLDIESSIHEESARDDEGEARLFRGVAAYPWEALGLYAPGTKLTQEYSDKDIQYHLYQGKVDLPQGAEDTQPIYRYQEYGGYLGQGQLRLVMKPGLTSGRRQLQPEQPDEGLFREWVGLDGTYSLLFAKRGYIGKRCKIVVPKLLALPESGQGDDAARNNYKFSGSVGAGSDHKIQDIRVTGADGHLRKVAAVQDIIAHIVNWQALHPFHYHQQDFKTWQEAETSTFQRVQEKLDYTTLEDEHWLPAAAPVKLKIDHRYGEVDYFERESFLIFQDDGSVQLGGGCGEHIVLAGGGITLECPAGLMLLAGTDVLLRGAQVSVNSYGSMDLSSARGDVRLKAENNMHLLAGNAGTGGMFLESRGQGRLQHFKGKFGADVQSSGIVLKASQGVCALLGQDIYLRSGGPGLGDGDILLDATKGQGNCSIYARQFTTFSSDAVLFNYGPIDESSDVTQVYNFGKDSCVIDSTLQVSGKVISYGPDGGLVANGDCTAAGDILCGGNLADREGGFVGRVPPSWLKQFTDQLQPLASQQTDTVQQASKLHAQLVVERYYQTDQAGADDTVQAMQFGFRDDPNQDQYGVASLKFLESRWMMLARLGLATGGYSWDEPAVSCQGEDTYPWPGKKKWLEDECFLQLAELSLFDTATGSDKDRPGPYEGYSLPTFQSTTLAAGFKINRH